VKNIIIIIGISVIAVIVCFACKNKDVVDDSRFKQVKARIDSSDKTNRKLIDDLGFSNYETLARWILYLKNLEKKPLCRSDFLIPENIYVGFLDLKLSAIAFKRDTLEIIYRIVFNDTLSIKLCSTNAEILDGVAFDVKKKKFLGYLVESGYYNDFDSSWQPIYPSFQKSLKFIHANKSKLNPWFRSELINRKIITE
jgi:CTP:phosphocholine cytidylyltransferase-like protein